MSEYIFRRKGFDEREHRRWEIARWQVWLITQPNYKPEYRKSNAKSFFPFPWDEGYITTEEQAIERMESSQVDEKKANILNALFDKYNDK